MKQHWYIAELLFLTRDLPDQVGDFDLICMEGALPDELEEREIEDQVLNVQTAPVHLHRAPRSRRAIVSYQQLDTMMLLEWTGDPEESLYLAPLTTLFSELPEWMAGKELGMVHVQRERRDGSYMAQVFPVTLHLAGPMVGASLQYDVIEQLLPLHQVPHKAHTCRQQRKR